MIPIGSLLLGAYEAIKGFSDLNSLHKEKTPQYAEPPEQRASRERANMMAERGFSGAEKNAFDQRLATASNTASQRAIDIGGGSLASVVGKASTIQNIGALSDFASRDAALHRQNIRYSDLANDKLQQIANRNVESQQRQRLMAEQALGAGISSGLGQIGSALNIGQATGSFGGKPNPLDWIGLLGKGRPYSGIPMENQQSPMNTDWLNTGGYSNG